MNIFNTQINSPGILTNAQKISKHASRQEYGQLFLNRISFDIQDLHVHFPKIILGILLLLGNYNFRLAFLALHFPCCLFFVCFEFTFRIQSFGIANSVRDALAIAFQLQIEID